MTDLLRKYSDEYEPGWSLPEKVGAIRRRILWDLRANAWGLILGCQWGITEKYPDWAETNRYLETTPKVWAASILVAQHEGKA